MAKPAGPACNLRCDYCFYLEKDALFPPRQPRRMDDATLEAFVRQYIQAQPGPRVVFAWQGGEPTLLGVDYYRRALALQRRWGRGR
ncbi:MAG TPA: radical SAM protein, partial [Ramlibacter sp.]|nr:radical SAM protein [Ramlibacter sp.]